MRLRPGQLKGFTLIELTVSISIMVIISTVMIANYRSSGRNGDLGIAAQKFMSDLRLVQNRALSMSEYNGALPAGWGVQFDLTQAVTHPTRKSYLLFADANGNGIRNNTEYDVTETEGLSTMTISLPPRVYIHSVIPAPASNRVNFIVQPPDPDIIITNNLNNTAYTNSIIIILGIEGSTAQRQIEVNRLGLIDML